MAFTLIYLFHDTIKINDIKIASLEKITKKDPHPLRSSKVIIIDIHMGIGANNSIGIELACPYKNKIQQSQLWKYSTRIKNDFLLSVGEEKLKKWVKKRNFQAIKISFLKIVNKYMDEPLSDVYISRFFQE